MPRLPPNPLISIVMPVYNGAPHFETALHSALSQTYPSVEIVVVDDGSTDDGYAERIAATAGAKVRYFYQENKGVAGALNRALHEMKGDVFCWLSHDDVYLPRKIERQVDFYGRLGTSNALIFSDYELIDDAGRVMRRISANSELLRRAPMLALLSGSINGCTIFAPVQLMRQARPFDAQYRYAQDYRFWNEMLRQHEFLHQPECLVQYRVHPQQGSNRPEAVIEGDGVWTAMIADRSSIERVQMAGSDQRFYELMAAHLAGSSYSSARAYATQAAKAAVDRAMISIVIPVDENQSLVEAALAKADAEQDVNLDIVLVGPAAMVAPFLHRRKSGLRIVTTQYDGVAAALNRGLLESRGDYIAFIRPRNSSKTTTNLRQRLEACQQHGIVAGLASLPVGRSLLARELIASSSELLVLEELMIHKYVVSSGFLFDAQALAIGDAVAIARLGSHIPIRGLGS